MSFTDFYFDREEKRKEDYARELKQQEFETRENFQSIFNDLQELRGTLELSLEDDDERRASLETYGDEFINDTYALLKKIRKFEKNTKSFTKSLTSPLKKRLS